MDNALVINVGELMTRWTNDHWSSTRHRVVPAQGPNDSRTTLTTFHMPALDAVIAPLEVCVGDNDPHYGPVTPYECERDFMARNSMRRALEVDPRSSSSSRLSSPDALPATSSLMHEIILDYARRPVGIS